MLKYGSIPNSQDEGCYLLLEVKSNGVIEHSTTMNRFELVNHLNQHLFEEIHCTIEFDL